ncbi:Neurogenic locus notch homolog protein 1 [Geodia barretti]|nr:Neurogenic locus notch homolog protein 1 [Geodia barretti]
MKSLRLSMLFLLLVIVVVGVHCYSTGAPASACSDIYPVGHLGTSQDLSTNPFQLSLSDFDQTYGGEIYYVPGQDYTLTLSGSGGEQFRGFLVQARALADGSPVGTFIDNGDDQTLSSCNPPESAITHMNNSLKSSVMLKWTAPLQKTREVQFLFSIVVQNSASNSTFYATARTKPLHSCGLPLYESAGHCVETCPDGQFGNGSITTLTGTCDPLPSDYAIALNATVYYAKIHIGQPLNTPVFRIRAFFNTTANIVTSSISLSQTGKINKLFEFEGGSNNRIGDIVVPIADHSVFDTSINLVQHPDTQFGESEYPVPLMIVISLNALLSNSNVMSASHVTSQGRGSIQDPCSNKPCVNGSCTPGISADYSCECFTGFTGTDCDENIDDCPGSECVNGTCVDGIANYTCDCDPGFNGTLCDQEINECHTADCNNGTCTDLVNDYMCQCYQDYTGQHCDTLLSCSSSPCENEGTCIDEEQGTFLCLCPPEWTGMTCGEDALPCDPNPCNNGGMCLQNGTEFSCNCAVGWTGENCTRDIDECIIDALCENGGTCENLKGSYLCDCPKGFEGMNCEEDVDFCNTSLDVCVNGDCVEGYGNKTSCNCSPGFTGDSCEDDDPTVAFCEEHSCANGGTCNEDYGPNTNCSCVSGYTGDSCDDDDPSVVFCGNKLCLNGGTCLEAFGDATVCLCPSGYYTRTNCTAFSCASAPCENGGTCVDDEDYSGSFKCLCPREWAGETCGTRASLTEDDPETHLVTIGVLVLVILLLCGVSLAGFILACKNCGKTRQ